MQQPSTPTYWHLSISKAPQKRKKNLMNSKRKRKKERKRVEKKNLYKLMPITEDKEREMEREREGGNMQVQKIIFTPLTYKISLYNCNIHINWTDEQMEKWTTGQVDGRSVGQLDSCIGNWKCNPTKHLVAYPQLPATLTYINTLSHKSQFSDAWNEQTEGIHFKCMCAGFCTEGQTGQETGRRRDRDRDRLKRVRGRGREWRGELASK